MFVGVVGVEASRISDRAIVNSGHDDVEIGCHAAGLSSASRVMHHHTKHL
jgi:hypothetical protein